MDITQIAEIVGPKNFFSDDEIGERYKVNPIGRFRTEPLCLVRPKSVEEIVSLVQYAGANKLPIVPVGGNTGLSGGTVADNAMQLSLERMNTIHEVDPDSMTMTVDAGVILQNAQEAAEAHGLILPLDLGSRGSATIGGNIASNAGGNRVVRWGMARDMVLGLEAVLADGSVVSSMGKMIKDNAGYNWKHLMIGSEGTLGIITRAVLRLRPKPISSQTALVAVDSFTEALRVLRRLEAELAGRLSSFELMWEDFYNYVTTFNLSKRQPPIPAKYGLYCLVESLGGHPEEDAAALERSLTTLLEDGTARDVVIAQSERERDSIWAVREDLMEPMTAIGHYAGYDISMAQRDIPRFKSESEANIRAIFPDALTLYYGHIGDGNMHLLVSPNDPDPDFMHKIDKAVYSVARDVHASIAGEHGIGLERREYLSYSRSTSEIALMHRLKNMLDPENILNPGKVL